VALADVAVAEPPDAVGTGTLGDPVAHPAAPTVIQPESIAVHGSDEVRQPAGTQAGIDVSHYQGSIDWSLVAASGIRFAFAKATEGQGYSDPRYLTNKADASANGVVFGAYHFARPDSSANDAVIEADHYVDTAALEPGDLVPVLDVERTGDLNRRQLVTWMLTWLGRVAERTGVQPMVYTSPNGWTQRTGDTSAIADAGYALLWVAHWNVTSPTVPANDWAGNGWTFWQYGNCGSVPGIDGCVDVDAFGGATFDDVTIPAADVTAPTVTLSTPLGGPVTVAFDEVVHDVTPDNTYVWTPSTGTYPDVSVTCRSGKGTAVDCVGGAVRSATIETVDPVILGESYEAVVNPPVVSSAVEDRSGNAAPTTTQAFGAPSAAEETDDAVRYGWRSVSNPKALGGSFVVERVAGASLSFAFAGPSVTWYTMDGPAQGSASVAIDGEHVGTFDGYASRAIFAVRHRFTGLARGSHVVTIRALGRASRAASDTQVTVDAFGVHGVIAKTPVVDAGWGRDGDVARSDLARSSVEVTFRGTGIDWISSRGPDGGKAAISVDGVLVREVDGYAPSHEAGVVRAVDGLAPGIHTLRIVVLGEARGASRGTFVTVDGFVVLP
jgi:GH25 family lysozyme M1 (1,4-beta-N-acetylmuramidase)